MLLVGNLWVTVNTTSRYFKQQLNARAYDAATSLALSMSHAAGEGDQVKLSRMMDVLFDRGFFAEIRLQLVDGTDLHKRARQATQEAPAPEWFMASTPLSMVEAGWGAARRTGVEFD